MKSKKFHGLFSIVLIIIWFILAYLYKNEIQGVVYSIFYIGCILEQIHNDR